MHNMFSVPGNNNQLQAQSKKTNLEILLSKGNIESLQLGIILVKVIKFNMAQIIGHLLYS